MKIPVLDHGYVEFIEAWGHGKSGEFIPDMTKNDYVQDFERGIIEAARQSTQGSFRGWDSDAKLLKFLYQNHHDTPFEFAGMVVEVQAPIFVFREWHRHRTQSYNEMSARYEPLPDLYFNPELQNVYNRAVKGLVTGNKQEASRTDEVSIESIHTWLIRQQEFYDQFESHYKHGLAIGIPKEIARIGMPVGHYSRMRASANLRNWLAFLTLRCDPKAQWEIRQFAQAVSQIISEVFPRTYQLFVDRAGKAG